MCCFNLSLSNTHTHTHTLSLSLSLSPHICNSKGGHIASTQIFQARAGTFYNICEGVLWKSMGTKKEKRGRVLLNIFRPTFIIVDLYWDQFNRYWYWTAVCNDYKNYISQVVYNCFFCGNWSSNNIPLWHHFACSLKSGDVGYFSKLSGVWFPAFVARHWLTNFFYMSFHYLVTFIDSFIENMHFVYNVSNKHYNSKCEISNYLVLLTLY